jgi:hypothetical protein
MSVACSAAIGAFLTSQVQLTSKRSAADKKHGQKQSKRREQYLLHAIAMFSSCNGSVA